MPNLIKLGSKIIFHEEFIDSKPFRNHHGSLLSYFLLQACRSQTLGLKARTPAPLVFKTSRRAPYTPSRRATQPFRRKITAK